MSGCLWGGGRLQPADSSSSSAQTRRSLGILFDLPRIAVCVIEYLFHTALSRSVCLCTCGQLQRAAAEPQTEDAFIIKKNQIEKEYLADNQRKSLSLNKPQCNKSSRAPPFATHGDKASALRQYISRGHTSANAALELLGCIWWYCRYSVQGWSEIVKTLSIWTALPSFA